MNGNISNNDAISSQMLESILRLVGLDMDMTAYNILVLFIPCLLGSISALACLCVFCMIRSNMPLYFYLRTYSVNNFAVCFMGIFQFFAKHYRVDNSSNMMNFIAWCSIPILSICYLNSTLLDVATLMDRIALFNKRAKEFMDKYSPLKWIIILFVYSTILSIPFFFYFTPSQLNLSLPNGQIVSIWYTATSSFTVSNVGQVILIMCVVGSNGYIMIIQTVLNIMSVYYIRSHFKRKASISSGARNDRQASATEIRTSIMVTIMCAVSFIEHIVIILLNVSIILRSSGLNSTLLQYILFCLLGLRRFFDFFFFMAFNKVFRRQVLAAVSRNGRVHTQNNTTHSVQQTIERN